MGNIAIRLTVLGLFASSLVGCAAAQVQMSKGELDVQTKMSATLFVDPPESEGLSDWKIAQTRILSSANKADLKFETAAPELKKALAQSIAAIF